MFAATASRVMIFKSTPQLTKMVARTQAKPLASSVLDLTSLLSRSASDGTSIAAPPKIALSFEIQTRPFSSTSDNTIRQTSVGTVTKKLRVLDMAVVKRILEGKGAHQLLAG